MLNVHSDITLHSDVSLDVFQQRLSELVEYLQSVELMHSVTKVARRCRHPVMDTDADDFELHFVLVFQDAEHVDRSVELLRGQRDPMCHLHRRVWDLVLSYRFTCWEDP